MERQKVWGWSKDISEASVNSCAVHRVGTKPLPGRVWHNIYCQPHSLILYHTCSVSGNHHGNMLSLHRITGVGRELLRPWSPTPLQNPCKTCFLQQVIQVVVQVEPEYLQRKRLYSFPGESIPVLQLQPLLPETLHGYNSMWTTDYSFYTRAQTLSLVECNPQGSSLMGTHIT